MNLGLVVRPIVINIAVAAGGITDMSVRDSNVDVIVAFDASIEAVEKIVCHLKSQKKSFMQNLVRKKLGNTKPKELSFSNWTCKKSPTGTCVYDEFASGKHDRCLFCKQPHVRYD